MSNEQKYRYKSYIATLTALFIAIFFGLAVAVLHGPTAGLATSTALLTAILWIANKLFSGLTPAVRIVRAAIGALAAGFTALVAVPSLQDRLIEVAARWLSGHNIQLTTVPDQSDFTTYFLIFAIAVIGCIVVYPILSQDRTAGQSTPSPDSTVSESVEKIAADKKHDDRVELGLPSRTVFITTVAASLLLPMCALGLHRRKILFSGTVSELGILDLIQAGLAGLCAFAFSQIWLARRAAGQSVRERLTFWAPPFLSATTGIVVMTFISGTTPLLSSLGFTNPDVRLQLFELALWLSFVGYYWIAIVKWDGRKSAQHHRAEDIKIENALPLECIRAYQWMWANQKWVRVHNPLQYTSLAPLDVPSEPVVWPQRGMELVKLKKRELDFFPISHFAHANCWLSKKRASSARVAVFVGPAGAADNDTIAHLEQHLPDILRSPGTPIECAIAVTDKPLSNPPNDVLGVQVEWLVESELLNTLVDFRSYIKDIRERVENDEIPNSNRTLAQVHVRSAIALPNGEACDDVEEYLNIWIREPGRRHVALLGDFGMGKSTAALMWTYRWLVESGFDGERLSPGFRVPIIIELRGHSPRNINPLALLAAWAMRYHIDANAIHHLVATGRVVLILEGFDETAFQGNEEARIAHFRTLWKLAYPKAKLLFTGRPNFFVNPSEREVALRLGKPLGDSPYCTAVTLCELNLDQIAAALRDQNERVREQIIARARSNERFRDLVSRPTLLHACAIMWERERLFDLSDERLTSAQLVGSFVRHSDRREGLKESESSTYQPVVTREERAYFMSGIACHMLVNRLPNQITGEELEGLVDGLYEAIPEIVSAPLPPLRERVGVVAELRYGMHTDIRTTGLLVEDGARVGAFRFAHKSYMEFLAGEQVAVGLADTARPTGGAIRFVSGIDTKYLRNEPEVTLFCAEVFVDILDRRGKPPNEVETARRLFMALGGGSFSRMLRRRLFRHWIRLGIANQKLIDNPALLGKDRPTLSRFRFMIAEGQKWAPEFALLGFIAIVSFARPVEGRDGWVTTLTFFMSCFIVGVWEGAQLVRAQQPSPKFIVWLTACLQANITRPNIAASLGLSEKVDADLPLLALERAGVVDVVWNLMAPLGLVLGHFNWRRFVLGALPSPPELYLVDRQLRFDAAILALRSVFKAEELLEVVEEANRARLDVSRRIYGSAFSASEGLHIFARADFENPKFWPAVLDVRSKYAAENLRGIFVLTGDDSKIAPTNEIEQVEPRSRLSDTKEAPEA